MTSEFLEKLDFKKGNGLIPVVVQDAKTQAVLMQAYANRGETSGHTQKVISVATDCDYDSLLYVVEQTGPACHTGEYSCFYNKLL
jgi:phosphoribosyl-ATP pyrophosphohydrolase/phosphoribosyl-AMP cyclohydrolase